jgi:hypothetical protein
VAPISIEDRHVVADRNAGKWTGRHPMRARKPCAITVLLTVERGNLSHAIYNGHARVRVRRPVFASALAAMTGTVERAGRTETGTCQCAAIVPTVLYRSIYIGSCSSLRSSADLQRHSLTVRVAVKSVRRLRIARSSHRDP